MVKVPVDQETCLRCKGGKFLCGLTYCPIILRSKALIPVRKLLPKMKNNYYGPSPPSIFVGRFGYPYVRLGPMAALGWQDIDLIDEPDHWQTNMSLSDIVSFRARLFRFNADPVKVTDGSSSTKIVEITQEQIQAKSPVDIEAHFTKKPKLDIKFDRFNQPVGTRIQVDKIQLTSTPKIDFRVDRVVSDNDLQAIPAVKTLYNSQASVTQITRLFSAGLLGTKENRKFVPTRWGITAVDDILGNDLRKKIRDYPATTDYMVFHNSYLDNDFWVLFLPNREWHFDYHETWKQSSAWNLSGQSPVILSDYEGPAGRKNYANNTVGGYYAARLAVLEQLVRIRRKAAVLGFREVGKEYVLPVGVWQVRENMRQAMKNPVRKFNSLKNALHYISKYLTVPMRYYKRVSPLLKQKTLDEFLRILS